jgi:glycerophosphoryl diester phosphodiesterase
MPGLARENTLPSFALALEAGADGVELDVHATRDGVVVVHHDPRLSLGRDIAALSYDELRRYEAAPGVGIPTLAEVTELVNGRATLFVEIKGSAIERAVLDVLHSCGGPYAVHSFDHALIRRAHALDPELRLGILYDRAPHDIANAMATTGARDVWPRWPLVTVPLVEAVHARGGTVIPWTVNDSARARALAALGVDGLCGDDVRLLGT